MKKNDRLFLQVRELLSQAAKEEIKKVKKERAYQQEKTFPVPSNIERFPVKKRAKEKTLGGKTCILQKPRPPIFEQLYCNQNQNYPLFFIEKAEAFQMRIVQNLKVKERLIAARNLRNVSNQMQNWMRQKVSLSSERKEEFDLFLQQREERHFQIDRIIRYLSDT